MGLLIAGLIIFFGPHFYTAFRSRAPDKDIKMKIGEGPYMGLYSLVSAVGLGLIVYGYMRAPPSGLLYAGPEWGRNASIGLMAAAFVLLAAAYIPNTHIKRTFYHPMVSAVILWSIAHLLTGADQAGALLFGSFLVFSLIDFVAASLRGGDLTKMPVSATNDLLAIAIGGGVFAAMLFWGHEAAFGIAPLL